MLAHSPSLPLIIDYSYPDWDTTAEEGRIVIAFEQNNRVRRVRLRMPRISVSNLQKLVMAIDEEYSVLEYLILESPKNAALMLPETLQAPHLVLTGFTLSTGSRLLTTAVGIFTLVLVMNLPSAYFQPNIMLRWLSFMPQLETLSIAFSFPVSNRDVERQLMITPITTHVASEPSLVIFPRCQRIHGRGCSSDHHPSPREAQHSILQAAQVFPSTSPTLYGYNREPQVEQS